MRSEADFLMRRNETSENNPWMDSNEQEQEKAGFSEEEPQKEPIKKQEKRAKKHELPILAPNVKPKPVEEKQVPAELPRKQKSVRRAEPSADVEIEKLKQSERETPTPKRRGGARHALLLSALFLATLALCVGTVLIALRLEEGTGELPSAQSGEEDSKEKLVFVRQYDDASGLLSLPELYATCADAVVSVQTRGNGVSGVGTGFFIREDGYIATVAHVVEGMEYVTVLCADGKTYDATVVATNAMTDLALLKIDGDGFPALSFGASNELLTGERVVAIGTPISTDYAGSLCTGEVTFALRNVKVYDSAGRVLQKKMKLIQTNAAVNPGNSGCPLFDEYGRVVGIITMKLGNDSVGVGFAIPSDGAAEILRAMMRGETPSDEMISLVSTSAPKLGIVGTVSQEMGIAGVRIVRFSSSRCDAALKLREGDLMIQLDGRPIATVEEMTAIVQEKSPGERVLVTVLRAEQRLTFEVILEKS